MLNPGLIPNLGDFWEFFQLSPWIKCSLRDNPFLELGIPAHGALRDFWDEPQGWGQLLPVEKWDFWCGKSLGFELQRHSPAQAASASPMDLIPA